MQSGSVPSGNGDNRDPMLTIVMIIGIIGGIIGIINQLKFLVMW